ncbi:MAG: DNA-deoxyinosine glycosylase [Lachnospiraceae bacterium]|nr:DNA-deoxyinosine glycosylase [Lachnospiraceae bacterium]
MTYETQSHTFEPVFDQNSRILILGTFPSVKSREQGFYYGHQRNRFWKLLAELTGEPLPESVEEKKQFLLRTGIAVWDVVSSCDIIGSSDSSIKNVVPADLSRVLSQAPIQEIFANGGKAYSLYRKYAEPLTGRTAKKLPSTSPANAGWQMERLAAEWKQILQYLDSEKELR